MEEDKEKILQETIDMLTHEFKSATVLLEIYLKQMPPHDPEGKYFRLRFMQEICEDLLEIARTKTKLDEDMVKGTEMAIAIFRKAKTLGKQPEFEDGR